MAKAKAQKGQTAFEAATLAVQHAMAELELQAPRNGVGAWDAVLGAQPQPRSRDGGDGASSRRRRNGPASNVLVL